MAEVASYSHGPEDEVREYHPIPNVQPLVDSPSNLVGQAVPYAGLLARLLACDLEKPRNRTFGVVGPTGVGKSSAVRYATRQAGYHLVETCLEETGSVDRSLGEIIAAAPSDTERVAVLVQSLHHATPAQLEELASSIDSRREVEVLRKGRLVQLPLDRYVWIFEVGGLQPGPTLDDPYIGTSVMPGGFERLLSPYVRFQALAATDLYAVVSRGLDPTLGEVCSWLRVRGIHATFSEMYLMEIAQAAISDWPYSGVRGAASRLRQLAVGIAMHNLAPEESR